MYVGNEDEEVWESGYILSDACKQQKHNSILYKSNNTLTYKSIILTHTSWIQSLILPLNSFIHPSFLLTPWIVKTEPHVGHFVGFNKIQVCPPCFILQ